MRSAAGLEYGLGVFNGAGINVAAAIYVFTLVAGFGVLYTQMVLMNVMGQYVMYDMRKQIFGHLQKLDVQYFDKNPVGRLMTRVTTDVDALNELFTAGFVAIFGDIFVLAGIVGVLFWMNWRLALVLFSITPFIILVSIWFRRGARITYRQVRARIASINAFLQEHITGMATAPGASTSTGTVLPFSAISGVVSLIPPSAGARQEVRVWQSSGELATRGIVSGIMIVVIPKFKTIFQDFDTKLPGITATQMQIGSSIARGFVGAAVGNTVLLLVFLVLGMLAGEDGPGGIPFNDVQLTYLIGSIALGIILFDGGMRTRREHFRVALWPSVALAVPGVVRFIACARARPRGMVTSSDHAGEWTQCQLCLRPPWSSASDMLRSPRRPPSAVGSQGG